MLETHCPEQIVKTAKEAAETIESRAAYDTQIPDIGNAFTAQSSASYEQPDAPDVQPIVPKHEIAIPPKGMERLQKWRPTDPAGILPEIGCAYFALSNFLYLWDYEELKEDIDTFEETAPILSIGLAKPKADVFNPEITHVLIIATASQIKVIALLFKQQPGAGKSLSFYNTNLCTPASGAIITSIKSTKDGRIFMLANDGNIWELDYKREEGWFTSNCFKLARSPNQTYDLVSIFKNMSHDPCVQIAVDENAPVLYTLHASSTIQVAYLGTDGKYFKFVAKNSNICNAAKLMNPSSPLLDSNTFKIVSIHAASPQEASSYQLVAITSKGCRLYLTYHKSISSQQGAAPDALELVHVRSNPPLLISSAEQVAGLQIKHSFYSKGVLLLVNEQDGQESLVSACPDIGRLAALGPRSGLSEFSNKLQIPGQTIAIAEMQDIPFRLNELASQLSEAARHFLIFTTHGMTIVAKQRPVDMLQNLLTLANGDVATFASNFESLFRAFGVVHSCALCFNIICNTSGSLCKHTLQTNRPVTANAVKGAMRLLEVQGQAQSARLNGLALFLYRLIEPFWNASFIVQKSQAGAIRYESRLPRDQLLSIQLVLRKVQGCMDQNPVIYNQSEPRTLEDMSFKRLYSFAILLAEAISFMLYIIDNDITRLLPSLKPEMQKSLTTITTKDLLTTEEGRELSGALANGLIDDHAAKFNNLDIVIDVLEQRCGQFCGASEVILYKAVKVINAAKTEVSAASSRNALQESLTLLSRIANNLTPEKVQEIADEYVSQNGAQYAVQLALVCAKARDPHYRVNVLAQTQHANGDDRADILVAKQRFYDIIVNMLLKLVESTVPSSQVQRDQALKKAFSSDDTTFLFYLYDKLVENKHGKELIRLDPPHLEEFLSSDPPTLGRYELLANFYRMNERYVDAARTFLNLAVAQADIPYEKRMEYNNLASVCIKSVTSPTLRFQMLNLQKDVEHNFATLNKQPSLA